MVKRRMRVQIRPRIIFRLPSTTSSAPMLTSWILLLLTKSSALLTFSNFWTRSLGLEAYLPRDSWERISSRWMRRVPSERSVHRSLMTRPRAEILLLSLQAEARQKQGAGAEASGGGDIPFREGLLLHNNPLLLKGSHDACAALEAARGVSEEVKRRTEESGGVVRVLTWGSAVNNTAAWDPVRSCNVRVADPRL